MQMPHTILNENDVYILIRAIRSRISEVEVLHRTLGVNYDDELSTLQGLNDTFTDIFEHVYGRVNFNE